MKDSGIYQSNSPLPGVYCVIGEHHTCREEGCICSHHRTAWLKARRALRDIRLSRIEETCWICAHGSDLHLGPSNRSRATDGKGFSELWAESLTKS